MAGGPNTEKITENTRAEFSLGAVVVPARDGMLAKLGIDVGALGPRALGLVVEARPNKCQVHFPEIRLSLWIPKNEMADVEARASRGEPAYSALLPRDVGAGSLLIWRLWRICRLLPVTHVLGLERSETLEELWQDGGAALTKHWGGAISQPASYIGVGVAELFEGDLAKLKQALGEDLLFVRVLPAGLHKIELACYLR